MSNENFAARSPVPSDIVLSGIDVESSLVDVEIPESEDEAELPRNFVEPSNEIKFSCTQKFSCTILKATLKNHYSI